MRAPFQGREIVAVEAAQPAIKSLAADAEVPESARGVPSVEEVEKHPLKPGLCGPAYTLSEARQLARLGKLIPSDLAHPDTLPSVTNHSERGHMGIAEIRLLDGVLHSHRFAYSSGFASQCRMASENCEAMTSQEKYRT